jgi:hypothetical protein
MWAKKKSRMKVRSKKREKFMREGIRKEEKPCSEAVSEADK